MKGFFKYGFPMVELIVNGKKVELLLDTGFNGHLMLPEKLIRKLNLEKIGSSDYTTASGEGRETEVYKARIIFFDEEIEVPILSTESEFALAGIEMFHNCKIIIERHSQTLEINKTSVAFDN